MACTLVLLHLLTHLSTDAKNLTILLYFPLMSSQKHTKGQRLFTSEMGMKHLKLVVGRKVLTMSEMNLQCSKDSSN